MRIGVSESSLGARKAHTRRSLGAHPTLARRALGARKTHDSSSKPPVAARFILAPEASSAMQARIGAYGKKSGAESRTRNSALAKCLVARSKAAIMWLRIRRKLP